MLQSQRRTRNQQHSTDRLWHAYCMHYLSVICMYIYKWWLCTKGGSQLSRGLSAPSPPPPPPPQNEIHYQNLPSNSTVTSMAVTHKNIEYTCTCTCSPWYCTSLASMTVPTPTVRADLGTLVTSPPKNLALASMVSTANDLILVRDTREEPGSLNAMCPSGPMPESQCTRNTLVCTWSWGWHPFPHQRMFH